MICAGKRLAKTPWRRAFSAQSVQSAPRNPYSIRNLRAYPFEIPPGYAQHMLAPFAAFLMRKKFIESILCWAFPNFGFTPLKPVRLQPVYFPAWILDVELQGQVSIKGIDRQASAQIQHAYVPGSDYKVLSSANLAPAHPNLTKSVPFSKGLLRQHGVDIACIPYNISPFSILDIAGDLSNAEATIEPNFHLIPSTLKSNLFAAYPILIPLYLAQYEVETKSGTRLHTMILEACNTAGNIWSEGFTDGSEVMEQAFMGVRSAMGQRPQTNQEVVNMLFDKPFVEKARFSLEPHQVLGESIRKYIEGAINLPGAATTLAAASVRYLDQLAKDRRIREFTQEERDPVIQWLKLGSEVAKVERMRESLSQAGNVIVKGPGVKQQNQQQFVDDAINTLNDKFLVLQANRLKIKPRWAKTSETQGGESSRGD
ncbi:hypothetical protein AGABI1DRAFT_114349 [Agaricus bisporus var. burnettii JB137-S8]|uniref:Uncharacterized protein n=1 Tax=Agaricus bisporus var. burnettii (strain JB137-S8 / ATCC MYA-4627 / FGSC 10392) TaxID=597362 RepID=K5X705_AGABU|nr:uncharacterized protein AGABI1DRAFT_114349 [Agaricus bisporus var. burnettii JB137-S8]EKM78747.1 hypothetical protein AGABI1DRAFT_114349 [Agaricus bisporus var. burnettii JB137-S8]